MGHIRVFRHYFHVPFLLLGALEAVILIASVYLAVWLRFEDSARLAEVLSGLWTQGLLFSFVMLIAMTAMSVYPSYLREGMTGVMLRTAVSYFIGSAVLAMTFYFFPQMALGRGIFFIAAAISFCALFFGRLLFSRFLSEDILKSRVLVLGAGEKARAVWDRVVESNSALSYVVVGFIPIEGEPVCIEKGRLIQDQEASLEQIAHRLGINEILVAPDDRRCNFPVRQLLDAKLSGIDVLDILNFFERESNKIEVDWLSPGWLVFADGFSYSQARLVFERFFDVCVSLAMLLLAWPIMLFTALAIMAEDGFKASVFYRQTRVGMNQRPFSIYKFRSMREDAEKEGAQWAAQADNRITRVGRFIRKYRIDELPQILNVLKGDMAIVGPRPERPEFVSSLASSIPYFQERHRVKPGITGWAQLRYPYGASVDDSKVKLKYDLYYVKNHSLLLDSLIVLQTIEVVLFGKGAR